MFRNGFHGDCAATFLVGNVDETGRNLVSVTEKALHHAILSCGPGKPFGVIGNAEFKVVVH